MGKHCCHHRRGVFYQAKTHIWSKAGGFPSLALRASYWASFLSSLRVKITQDIESTLYNGTVLYLIGNEFAWSDQSAVIYENWAPGEPNGEESGEDCVEIYIRNAYVSYWNDHSCTSYRPFLCKVPQGESLTLVTDGVWCCRNNNLGPESV